MNKDLRGRSASLRRRLRGAAVLSRSASKMPSRGGFGTTCYPTMLRPKSDTVLRHGKASEKQFWRVCTAWAIAMLARLHIRSLLRLGTAALQNRRLRGAAVVSRRAWKMPSRRSSGTTCYPTTLRTNSDTVLRHREALEKQFWRVCTAWAIAMLARLHIRSLLRLGTAALRRKRTEVAKWAQEVGGKLEIVRHCPPLSALSAFARLFFGGEEAPSSQGPSTREAPNSKLQGCGAPPSAAWQSAMLRLGTAAPRHFLGKALTSREPLERGGDAAG